MGPDALVDNSSVTEGCDIYGTVRNSVLGAGVVVMKGAEVSNSVIMDGVVIEENTKINYAIVDTGCQIGKNCQIGKEQKKAKGITVIGEKIAIPAGTEIGDNEMISELADIKVKEEA